MFDLWMITTAHLLSIVAPYGDRANVCVPASIAKVASSAVSVEPAGLLAVLVFELGLEISSFASVYIRMLTC